MGRFRDIKRQARRDLHEHMQVAALYLTERGATPLAVTVRLHTQFAALGDQRGTSFNYAEMIDRTPSIIFMRSEVTPKKGAIVSVAPGEAYELSVVHPPDDITIKADVAPMSQSKVAGLPVPEEA